MKNLSTGLFFTALFLVSIPALSRENINPAGIWTGNTTAMPFQMDISLTLTLRREEGKWLGAMSDNMNFITNPIFDVDVAGTALTFKIKANIGESPTLQFRLNISQDRLDGEWKSTDGVYGKWTAERKRDQTQQTAEPETISMLMAKHDVPGAGLAVIDDWKPLRPGFFGVIDTRTGKPVTADTLFLASSVSKAITAVLVMNVIDRKILDLDEDVNRYLKSWKIPESPYTQKQPVTLRLLLSHRAGMPETDFPRKAGAGDPTRVQILNGESPAMNKPAFPECVPGTMWRYSNIGYVVIQQILEDVLKKPFDRIARDIVFDPLEMDHSSFLPPTASGSESVEAMPHDADGIPGNPLRNLVAAAHGGLMTTPPDLAVFVIEIMKAFQGKPERLISRESAEIMVEEEFGLFRNGGGRALSFYHPGQDLSGATAWVVGFPHTGQGAVILTNGAKGLDMTRELLSRLAKQYRWPD